MTFLGKEYNTETMTVRIPEEKNTDIIECVTSFKHKKKCTKRQLQQLIG
jgi:acetolactate synthase small subunit